MVHVFYLYSLNAPGSSAKQSMSPDSKASSARPSSSSTSLCRCHGSKVSQTCGAVESTKEEEEEEEEEEELYNGD